MRALRSEEEFIKAANTFLEQPYDEDGDITESVMRKIVEREHGKLDDADWAIACGDVNYPYSGYFDYQIIFARLMLDELIDLPRPAQPVQTRTRSYSPPNDLVSESPMWDQKCERLVNDNAALALMMRAYLGLDEPLEPSEIEGWFMEMSPRPRHGFAAIDIPYIDGTEASRDFPIQVVSKRRYQRTWDVREALKLIKRWDKGRNPKASSLDVKQTKLIELKIVAEDMAKRTGWQTIEAVAFILCDEEPRLSSLTVEEGLRSYPRDTETGAIAIYIEDMTISAQAIRDTYSRVQKEWFLFAEEGIGLRRTRTKAAQRAKRLLDFVQDHQRSRWAERVKLWNSKNTGTDAYKDERSMRVACFNARKRFMPSQTKNESPEILEHMRRVDEYDNTVNRIRQDQKGRKKGKR